MKRSELVTLLLTMLMLCPMRAVAQEPAAIPIADAFIDHDGDRVPDRLGEAVAVEGVVLGDPLVIGRAAALGNLQDSSAGATLFSRDTTVLRQFSAGDSIRGYGRVGQHQGGEQIQLDSAILLGHPGVPEPRDALVRELLGERLSGRLVRVAGTLTTTSREGGWVDATIEDRSGEIPINVSAVWLTDPDFVERLRRGGEAEVVAVASQRTFSDPPVDGYLLYPRGIDDFQFAPVPRYDYLALAVALLIIVGLILWRRAAARRAIQFERLAVELEESREELQVREERFRSLVENAIDTVSILDGEGVLLYQSPSITRMLGWRPEEVIGHNVLDYVDEADRPRVGALLAELRDQPDASREVEFRIRTADGSWRDLEVVATNRLGDPAVGGIVCNARDATHQNVLEQRLRQADRLDTVGRLAGGVAHDFNNILTALRGHAEIALQEMPADAAGRADVQEIIRNTERASEVIGQLLAFTRQQMRASKVVSASSILRGMLPTLRRIIGEDIQIEAELCSTGDHIDADPSQIEQVILNLIVNARDAMPEGGRIDIEVLEDEITEAQAATYPYLVRSGHYVHIRVSDTGTGMDDDILSHAFEPFFTTKDPGEGTGLGLATVYGIVKQSGGYIWARSEPGAGTRFDIYLPKVATAESVEHPSDGSAPSAVPTGGGETVLLVEDEDAVRSLVARVLRKHGYRVMEASGAGEAQRLAEESSGIDVVLTDVVMPGLSGVKLVALLEQRIPGFRVLFMSGYTAGETVVGGAGESAPLLEKPFTPQQLLESVRDVLGLAADPAGTARKEDVT